MYTSLAAASSLEKTNAFERRENTLDLTAADTESREHAAHVMQAVRTPRAQQRKT
jgi:hypothetical protein